METRRNTEQSNKPVTTEQVLVHSDLFMSSAMNRGEAVTNLPYATFDGITWIPNVSPERDRLSHTMDMSISVKDASNAIQETDDGGRNTLHPTESNATEVKPSHLDTGQETAIQVQGREMSSESGNSPQLMYMFPQNNSDSANKVDFIFSQTTSAGESVVYQSKLKKAVTKAKAKKRGKTSVQQPEITEIVNTYTNPVVAPGLSQEMPMPDVVANLDGGMEQSDTTPVFIAVPLSNITMGLKTVETNSEINLSPPQYQDLLNAEIPEVRDIGNADALKVACSKVVLDGQGNNSAKTDKNNVAFSNILHCEAVPVSVSEMNLNSRPSLVARLSHVPDTTTEKMYEDKCLSKTILEAMWHMIEADLFWDAILYIGKHHVKLHKLVMASISSIVHAKILSNDEAVLKLKLPADLDHMVVRTFVSYLYHGSIMITVQNVQDLYRISSIFEMDQLKKHCYDFCKVTKMAHVIINSPQEDTVKAVQFGEPETKSEDTEIPIVTDEIANTTADLIENIDLEASEITIEFAKVEDKKEEVVFDWTGVDENESNIPIRKRGRSRKGIINPSVASKSIAVVEDQPRLDNLGSDNNLVVDKVNAERLIITEKNFERQDQEPEIEVNFHDIHFEQNDIKQENVEGKDNSNDIIEMEREIPSSIAEILPDPFDGGRFDESKLTKTKMSTLPSPVMITRFRGRNKNILQAAESKKARLDEGTEKHDRLSKDNSKQFRDEEKSKPKKQERMPRTRFRAAKGKQLVSEGRPLASENETSTAETDIVSEIVTTRNPVEKKSNTPQPMVKKGRSKRSLTEPETPQKKEAPMRPPPKKRTKEISEMMKNVDKDPQSPGEKWFQEESSSIKTKKEKTKSKVKSENLSLPKTEELRDKIAEIDEKGRQIEGDRMFRCDFCGNEYLCVRRVLTHVVKTHDIKLDRSVDHIKVLKKNLSPKVCDICGYKAKDANIYYIHFHKYFRHGTPLPQGWKPFKCDFCGKEFFTKFQLKEHKLAHFEETPFVCEHCGNGFKTRTCLNSHVFHKHSSVKKHQCTECPKTFKTRTQMLVHMRIHSGEKPFSCPHCTYKSTTRGNMRLHLTNRHKFETDKIKNIMENLKATEIEFPVDEDGNIIKMKESGFAVKLGSSDGQILQIDPAGSAETQSMDTLALIASNKANDSFREEIRNTGTEEPAIQNQSDITDMNVPRSYDDGLRSKMFEINHEKPNGMSGAHQGSHSRDDEFLDPSILRPVKLVIKNTEEENTIEMRMLNSGTYPIGLYRHQDMSTSLTNEQHRMSDDRIPSSSGPQPKETRMIVRDVLRGLDQRSLNDSRSLSLLKEALAQSPIEHFDPRDSAAAEAEIIEVSEAFFQENNLILNSQQGQIIEPSQSQFISNIRQQGYEGSKDFSAEPLQLVTSANSLQSKHDRLSAQIYHNNPLSSQQYNVKSSSKVLVSRMPEIPTVISEEIQQLDKIPVSGQSQSLSRNQGYEIMTSKPTSHQQLNVEEEQQLMYDNFYQHNYHHGYQ